MLKLLLIIILLPFAAVSLLLMFLFAVRIRYMLAAILIWVCDAFYALAYRLEGWHFLWAAVAFFVGVYCWIKFEESFKKPTGSEKPAGLQKR